MVLEQLQDRRAQLLALSSGFRVQGLRVVDPAHENRTEGIKIDDEVESAENVVKGFTGSAQNERVTIGDSGLLCEPVEVPDLVGCEPLAEPDQNLVGPGICTDLHAGTTRLGHQLGELGVEAERIRIARPGNRHAPVDHLPTNRLRVAFGKVEDRVDHEDVSGSGLLLEDHEEFVNHGAGLADAAHAPFDDGIRAVIAAQWTTPFRLEGFDAKALVVARIHQRPVGGRQRVHVEKARWRAVGHELTVLEPVEISDSVEARGTIQAVAIQTIEQRREGLLGLARDAVVGAQPCHQLSRHHAEAAAPDHDGGIGDGSNRVDQLSVVVESVGRTGVVGVLDIAHSEGNHLGSEVEQLLGQRFERFILEAEVDERLLVSPGNVRHDRQDPERNGRVGEQLAISGYERHSHADQTPERPETHRGSGIFQG